MTDDIVASIGSGILTFGPGGQLMAINPAAEAIFGVRANEAVGLSFAQVFVPIEGLDAFNDCVLAAIAQPNTPVEEDVVVEVAAGERHLSVRANLLREATTGAVEGLIVVVTDVSERVAFLEQTAVRETERASVGRFIVAILLIFSIFTLLLEPIQDFAEDRLFDFGPIAAMVALVVIAFLVTRWTGTSLADYGLHARVSRREVKVAVLWSLGLCAVMTAAKFIIDRTGGDDGPLFEFFTLDDGTAVDSVGLYALGLGIYLVSVLFQEFSTRCAIQAPLERFLTGVFPSPAWVANLTATMLFAVLHAHLNPLVSVLVIPPSILWGWLFMRSGSVVTPIVSHTIIGVYGIFVLGIFAGLDQM